MDEKDCELIQMLAETQNITKAAERIYEYLGVSRFTLYNYLDIVRKETNAGAPPQEESTS